MPIGLLMCALAACGGSSDSEGSDGSDGSGAKDDGANAEVVKAAQQRLDKHLAPVTDLEVSTPLTRKPDAGKKIYLIRFNLPIAQTLDGPFKEAAEALGWEATVLPVDGADPQSISNATLRALSEGADFIVESSSSPEAIGPGLEAAKAAGVPVFLQAATGEIGGEANGIYGNTQGDNAIIAVVGLLDQMIVDSNGSGTALLVNAPDFPTLTPVDAAAESHVAENCSGCSLEKLGIPAGNLGGDTASPIVAAIRQNPDIKYVVASFDDLANGLPQALKAAGLDQEVKVYLAFPQPTYVKGIASGDFAAGLLGSDANRMWLTVDQVARQSLGMDVQQDQHGPMNMQLWTTDKMPEGATSWDPPDFKEKYKALWQVK